MEKLLQFSDVREGDVDVVLAVPRKSLISGSRRFGRAALTEDHWLARCGVVVVGSRPAQSRGDRRSSR
jgi:hypothetical protein